jgi:galactosamine-6-phosphate isomerase
VPLEEETQSHSMVETLEEKPRFGITLGMEDILKSKKVILMVTGTGKEAVFEKFQSKKITPKVPVSALWEHPNCLCFVDLSAFS